MFDLKNVHVGDVVAFGKGYKSFNPQFTCVHVGENYALFLLSNDMLASKEKYENGNYAYYTKIINEMVMNHLSLSEQEFMLKNGMHRNMKACFNVMSYGEWDSLSPKGKQLFENIYKGMSVPFAHYYDGSFKVFANMPDDDFYALPVVFTVAIPD